eukprot:CAMPEP_0198685630 /NCGR_PEP_ID=MMETSP1468-20131203/13917_1 /TAXON_ID=1461545 /ORGANISM="Mantoniella sp, Strain CCMP1436" /LENGTH=57 /DNA_ID=CAMNT_0044431241 /DNA_START=70 /DNA_END=241 /DNA_ORIENTATION=-
MTKKALSLSSVSAHTSRNSMQTVRKTADMYTSDKSPATAAAAAAAFALPFSFLPPFE